MRLKAEAIQGLQTAVNVPRLQLLNQMNDIPIKNDRLQARRSRSLHIDQ